MKKIAMRPEPVRQNKKNNTRESAQETISLMYDLLL